MADLSVEEVFGGQDLLDKLIDEHKEYDEHMKLHH